MTEKWIELARADLGTHEIEGDKDDPRIMGYYRAIGQSWVEHDEVAWCAAFVGACLERAGITSTRSLAAQSYKEWGTRLSEPRDGCVVVLWRNSPGSGLGHVGFMVRETDDYIYLLGGNQGDSVSIAPFPKDRVLAYRWPVVAVPVPEDDKFFHDACTLMIDLEGGYGEDPHDPGGPTNKGITLTDLAAYKGIALTDDNYADVKSQLRSISDADARAIYWKDYWLPVSAPELPKGLALFAFDTAVLQGVGRAKKWLQEAVGAEIDGEIGPKTKGAAIACDERAALKKFRSLRILRLRSSKNWNRFGDGWRNRITAVLQESLKYAEPERKALPAPKHPEEDVTDATPAPLETPPKPWTQSLTVWGAIVTFLSTVVPAVGSLVGIDISADLVHTFGDSVAHLIEAFGGVVGTTLVIYGRFRATTKVG